MGHPAVEGERRKAKAKAGPSTPAAAAAFAQDDSIVGGEMALSCYSLMALSWYFNRENPRLCRGGSRRLTIPGVVPGFVCSSNRS